MTIDEQIEQQIRHHYIVNQLKLPSPSRLRKQTEDMKRQLQLSRPRKDKHDPVPTEVLERDTRLTDLDDDGNIRPDSVAWLGLYPHGTLTPTTANYGRKQ